MKKITLILILFFLEFSLLGQNNLRISGFVYDETSGEVLIGATIYDKQNKHAVASNEYGFYSLTVPANTDSLTVCVSYVGYVQLERKISVKNNKQIDFYLKSGIDIDAITVSATEKNSVVKNNETGVIHLQMKEVSLLPNLFGEVDIIKAFQLTSGVQSGGESKSNLYVRGGSPDQNLILLDDVPLYYVAHFGGFLSVFNSDVINDVKLIKGGFPARYGGRLSSVLDIRMKEGNMNKMQINGTLGLLSSKISLEAPLIKNKMSLMVSARKNLIPILQLLQGGISYSFYDLNAKIKYNLSGKDKLFLSFYKGDDIVQEKNRVGETEYKNLLKWGNTLYALRWNHVYGNKMFSNFTFSNTVYQYQKELYLHEKFENYFTEINNTIHTGINDVTFKTDFTYLKNTIFNFRWGTNSKYHNFIPNNEYYQQISKDTIIERTFAETIKAYENSAYLENEIRYKNINSNIGARYSTYYVTGKYYSFFEPRVLLNFIINERLSVKYSYSVMYQYSHLLSFSGTGIPSDYWMPSTKSVEPERAVQNSINIVKTFGDAAYVIDFELYHKHINNLITFKEGMSLIGNFESWENIIEKNGEGYNYGLEFNIKKRYGKTTGWINFSLSKSERQFENINNGKKYPYKYNRLVNTNLVFIHKINKNINFTATWTYGSGYPITLVEEHYIVNDIEVFVYGKKNAFKMRDYHRLDIAFNFTKKKKNGKRTWAISIFNLYNRQNPYYYYYDRKLLGYETIQTEHGYKDVPKFDDLKLYQRSLFSIFPSFSYSFEFNK